METENKQQIKEDITDKSSPSPAEDTMKKNKPAKNSHSKPRASHKIKEKNVKELSDRIQKSKTLMIVDIKGLPSPQFQAIKKDLREHAQITVAKKNILKRVIKELKDSASDLESEIKENCAFAISDLDGFELAGILSKNKTPVFAKAGQEAPEDIKVQAGPTSLLPGPAISELGSLGIQVAVEEGKISIKAPKVVVNKGGTISQNAASLFQKLDIKPFNIGLIPIAVYDIQEEKIYKDIKINSEETIEDLKSAAGKALGFAQKIVYYCKDTIGYLLAKANANNQALEKLAPAEEAKSVEETENKEETKVEEKVEEQKTTESPSETPATDIKEEKKEETQTENTDNKSEEEK